MLRLTMSDTLTQATATMADRMNELATQHKVLVTTAFPAFVSMARLQAGESALDMKCGDGKLLVEIVTAVGESAEGILGLDDNHDLLRPVSQLLRSKNLKQYIKLFKASLLETDANAITQSLTANNLPTTFDTIFAIDILPSDTVGIQSNCQHSYMSKCS